MSLKALRHALATPLWLLPLAAGAMFWRLLFAGRVLVWGTPLLQFYPWETLAARLAWAGQWPLWNPYAGNGAPLLANLQSAVFYPPNWLYLLVPVEHGMSWLAALHVVWAGLGTYTYTRQLGLPRFGALVSTLAFALNGYLIARLSFLSITYAVAWLPWLFYAADRLLLRRRLIDAGRLAAVVALQLLAGHAQTSAYSLFGLGLYVLWRLAQGARAHSRRETLKAGALVALGLGLACAVAAVQLAPTAELLRESQRAGGVDAGFGLQYSYWPWRLFTLFVPDLFGTPAEGTYWGYGYYHEDHNYVGLLPLALAVGAIAGLRAPGAGRRGVSESVSQEPEAGKPLQPGTWLPVPGISPAPGARLPAPGFFAFIAALSLFLALGKNTPITLWLFDHVPGFAAFQAPTRWTILFVWAACVLAGAGAARWQSAGPGPEGPRGVRYWSRLSIAGGLVAVLLPLLLRQGLPPLWLTLATSLASQGVRVVLIALAALVQPEPGAGRRGRLWETGVLALVAADLVAAGYGLNPTVDASVYAGTTGAAAALRAASLDAARTFMPPNFELALKSARYDKKSFGPETASAWREIREMGLPNTAALDGLNSANNFDPLLAARYQQLLDAAGDDPARTLRVAQLMGAGTLIWRSDPEAAETARRAGWGELVYTTGDVSYYRVPNALPRAYAVPAARVAPASEAQLATVLDPAFDPRREVVLGAAPPGLPAPAHAFSSTVKILEEDSGTITLHATLSAPGVLVLADTYYPGWQATVAGQPAELLRANYAFRAVALPAGNSVVQMAYRPESFRWGGLVTLVASVLLLGLLWSGRA